MNKKSYTAILDDVAREYVSDDVDLAPRILSKIEKEKRRSMQPRVKILIATAVTLLVLAFLLIRVPAVAEAMQRMLNRFIPGIGMVDVSTIRTLDKPVTVTRDGITVTVDQLVADSQHTMVDYRVDGLPEPIKLTYEGPDCLEVPKLLLSNGAELKYLDGSSTSGESTAGRFEFSAGYEFGAIPTNESILTFVIPCLQGTDRGVVPENWEIPLTLIPAPPDMTTYPVIELVPTMQAQATPTAQTALSTPTSTGPVTYDFTLSVDRVVPLDGSYRLYARLDGHGVDLVGATVRLLSTDGKEIPGGFDPTGLDVDYTLPIVFEAMAEYSPGTVTLVVESVIADIRAATPLTFSLDLGQNPHVGQEWTLNQDIEVGGYTIHLATAQLFERNGEYGLNFQMSSLNQNVHSVWLLDLDRPSGRYGGRFLGYNGDPFNTEVTYEAGYMPSGLVTISVAFVSVTLDGPWQTTLTLPPVEETPDP